MDADRFDALTRSLPSDRSRRGVLRLLTGILGGSLPVLAQGEAAARCRRRPCRKGTCTGCCDTKGCCRGGTRDGACGQSGASCEACSGTTPRCSQGVCSQCREDLHCSAEEFCCLPDDSCAAGTCMLRRVEGVDCSRNKTVSLRVLRPEDDGAIGGHVFGPHRGGRHQVSRRRRLLSRIEVRHPPGRGLRHVQEATVGAETRSETLSMYLGYHAPELITSLTPSARPSVSQFR